MWISSMAGKDDAAGQIFLGDVFAETAEVATEILGAPTVRILGSRPQSRSAGPRPPSIGESTDPPVPLI